MTLKEASDILKEAGIDDPVREARLIFSLVGGIKEYELISLSVKTDSKEVGDAVLRRAKREPLQYILGKTAFYRETYKVTKDTLIPREDTEILVDYAVRHIPKGECFVDLCTGSGCIALSVLNNTDSTSASAVDISEAALIVAKENAESLGLSDRISFACADATKWTDCGRIFALLSNPPYVSDQAYKTLEQELYYEPRAAFVGGEDGGDFYRAITPLYRDLIADEGFIAYEIGYDQKELLSKIADDCRMSVEILKDLSGNDRVAVLRKIAE